MRISPHAKRQEIRCRGKVPEVELDWELSEIEASDGSVPCVQPHRAYIAASSNSALVADEPRAVAC